MQNGSKICAKMKKTTTNMETKNNNKSIKNLPKWRPKSFKISPWRCLGRVLGPSWLQVGILGLSWRQVWKSWGRSLQKWLKCKNEHHYGVLATFSSLGGSGWRLLGLSWGILARSWAILGDLGVKLGPCWQHVGTKMAKMSQDRRTWEQNEWL